MYINAFFGIDQERKLESPTIKILQLSGTLSKRHVARLPLEACTMILELPVIKSPPSSKQTLAFYSILKSMGGSMFS